MSAPRTSRRSRRPRTALSKASRKRSAPARRRLQSTTSAAALGASDQAESAEEDEGVRPIPDRLVTELTAHRTLALRDALANDPDTAFVAALHVLCLKLFYRYALNSCLEIEPKSAMFGGQAPGLADTASAKAIDARHAAWAAQLPKEPATLWDALMAFDHDSRQGLFAHCVSLTVNAVSEVYNRRPKATAHADRLAQAVALDMAAVGWRPTVDNYLGRVTKGRILQAVSEAKGDTAAERIRPFKKADMAKAAEELLTGTGWLPEPLRTPGQTFAPGIEPAPIADAEVEAQSADNGGEPAMDESGSGDKLPNRRLRPRRSRPNNTTSLNSGPPQRGPFLLEAAMSESIADLARRLAHNAEAVCRHYLSNGRRHGRYWIVGDLDNNTGRSLYVRLYGADSGKGAAGKWTENVALSVMLRSSRIDDPLWIVGQVCAT